MKRNVPRAAWRPIRLGLRASFACLLLGCTPFRQSTDAMFARHPAKQRDLPASAPMAPLALGQWTLYHATTGPGFAMGGALRLSHLSGFERLSVTDGNGGHLRVREWDQNEYQKVWTAAWFPGAAAPYPLMVTIGGRSEQLVVPYPSAAWPGWGTPCAGFSGVDCLYQCLPGGWRPESTDRPEGLPIGLRGVGAAILQRVGNDPSIPRMDVTTPAGTFHGAIQVTFQEPRLVSFLKLEGPITLWLHPAVPIDGVIRADIPQGGAHTMLELVDFGGR